MLLIHRAERADALVAALGAQLAVPSADPFAPEIVAVPSRGVERWLAQQLSHVLGARDGDGVCANVLFPPAARLLDEAAAEADSEYAEALEAWSPERSVWPLLRVIDRCAPTESWCAVLAAHLGLDGGADKGRRFAVAGKLARLFDRYGRARPDLLNAWRDGRNVQDDESDLPDDLTWQAQLWRRLRDEIGSPSPAELLDRACAAIGDGPSFSIFGATRISPARVRILAALSAQREVHLWLHHPSPALWDAVQSATERPGRRRAQRPVVRHPLLASMSRDVRELQQLLQDVPHDDTHHPIPARPATLLGRLQSELARDVVPSDRVLLDEKDNSVRVHAAHGPARQVEIVREAVLGLLRDDPTLEPRDVLIMCPDIEAYAPLVAAAFGMTDEPDGHPAARLRVKLADRSLRQTNPLLSLLSQLLEVAAGRVTATQVLDVAGASPVRRRFGFDGDDLERLRGWTVTAGARWGLDAQHRSGYGLQAIAQGTWRTALDRVLLGVSMEDDRAWLGDTLPLDDVDSGDIDLAGRFAELVDRLDELVRACAAPKPVAEWMRVLAAAIGQLGEAEHAWQAIQLRRELDDVADDASADADLDLSLAEIAALLQSRLAGRPTRASFRTGTLTVCTLVPMRSVPHRVVCLLGMDDGGFPRQGVADGDDVLAREPRTGERDIRSEDRQLFLDAICAAQEHLLISYTGADPRSGAAVPPCVPLGELLDAIDATASAPDGGRGREHVVVHHPLQPFDARNFEPDALGAPGPFSFDPSGLAGARAAMQPRRPVPPLVSGPLPEKLEATVDLADLIRFLQHPVRGFLRQRLDISTYAGDEDPADALPIELDGLQGWAVGDRVLQQCLAGATPSVAARLEYLRGELPPGPLGSRTLSTIGRRVDALLAACADEREISPSSLDISVPLPDGRVLAGTIGGVHDHTLLAVTYSTLAPKHRLPAWVRYLAAVAATGDNGYRAITIGRSREDARRAVFSGVEPQVAAGLLGWLVALRDAGLRAPLPMGLATSAEYGARRHGGDPVADALVAACQVWEADRFRPERDDPEHVLVFGAASAFAALTAEQPVLGEPFADEPSRFGALARVVWEPLLTAETS